MNYITVIEKDFMAGHGTFDDRWRVSIYLDSEHRPLLFRTVVYRGNVEGYKIACERVMEAMENIYKKYSLPL